jgi:drug/metabolite transporter (DMT)-like permease
LSVSHTSPQREQQGVLLCLLAAAGFAAMAIFAKLGYEAGFDVSSLLLMRFIIAGAVLWIIVAIRRPARPTRKAVLLAAGLGALGYAVQAATFFASLERLDASLASLLLYVYPTLVLVGAVVIGRERATRRRVGALALASAGTVLVLLGGGGVGGDGHLDPLGIALVFAAALSYAAYILVSDRHGTGTDPFLLTAMIITAAAVAVGIWSAAHGGPDLHVTAQGWEAVGAIAVISTVVPTAAFLVGMRRIGPATASIVATLEPVVTVVLAMIVFGDHLGPVQLLGGAGVIGAVVLVNLRVGSRERVAAPVPAAAAPARTLA